MDISKNNSLFIKLSALAFLILLLSSCGTSDSESDTDTDTTVSDITVNPGNVLLPGISETIQLSALAVNSNGDTIDTPIQWKSNKPNEIAVDENGVVTSFVVLGNASITAFQGDIESTPVRVTVATFAPDVKVVEDDDIVSPPQLDDPQQLPSVDNPITVSLLKSSSVELGDKLLGTGTHSFGGEVVAIEILANELRVTLVTLPLDELFDHLAIDEVVKLNQLEKYVDPKVAEIYDVKTLNDGSIEFTLKPQPKPKQQREQARLTGKASTYESGGFECLYDGAVDAQLVSFNVTPDHFVINHDLDLIFDYDMDTIGLKKIALDGVIEAGLHYDVKLLAQFDGFAECEMELFVINPTLPGVPELAMPLSIPISVGVRYDGKVEAIAGTMQTSGSINSSVVMGIECDEVSCRPLFDADNSADFSFDYQLSTDNQLADSIKLEQSLMPYATVGFRFWGYNFSSLRAGLAETHKAGLPQTLIKDETYEAEYYLSTEVGFIPGQKHSLVWDGLKFLNISTHADEINVEESLESTIISRSPIASRVAVTKQGDWDSNPGTNQLQFDVSIVPTTENYYQFPQNASSSIDAYNIEELVIMRVADPNEFSISAEEIARVEALPGQTEFTINTFGEFLNIDPAVRYYVFVITNAGLKITEPSGSVKSVEQLLLGKTKLNSRIEIASVKYFFSSQSSDDSDNTCDPYRIFTNHPEHMDESNIDRSIVRNSTYTTATEIGGKASTSSTNTFTIDATAETTEFILDSNAVLESVPGSNGFPANFASVQIDFNVLDGAQSCTVSGSAYGGYSAFLPHNIFTNNYQVFYSEAVYSLDLAEGENSIVIQLQAQASGETLTANSHISIMCESPLTVLEPEPVTSADSILIEDCIQPNPGGGGGPL